MTPTPAQIEALAAVICHAEFSTPRNDTPEEYWQRVSERARSGYRRSAERVLWMWTNPALWRAKLVEDVARRLQRKDAVVPGMACKAKADEIVAVMMRSLATWDANDG
jgi:hypothetical protein